MAQVDPWEKAADCERAIRITLDPLHRETLTNIREFWIALAHKSRFLSDDALATQIETIGRLHAKFDRRTPLEFTGRAYARMRPRHRLLLPAPRAAMSAAAPSSGVTF